MFEINNTLTGENWFKVLTREEAEAKVNELVEAFPDWAPFWRIWEVFED